MNGSSTNLIYPSFVEAFSNYHEAYTIIGGTACAIILDRANIRARATKDYDIVIRDEGRNEEFYNALIRYLCDGGYQMESREGTIKLYRFITNKEDYPPMIELLSKKVDLTELWDGPIRTLSFGYENSLSAIMLDGPYYDFLIDNTVVINNLPILNENGLLVLKAKAFYNLSLDKMEGRNSKNSDVRKHISDISRLLATYTDISRLGLNEEIRNDMSEFIFLLENDPMMIPESRDYQLTRIDVLSLLKGLLL